MEEFSMSFMGPSLVKLLACAECQENCELES